ncbi:MAG: hypothetical protein QOK10_91 [Pseudonocardiales bacterium]|jgi:hypothetical protein|nr:hypothetical protein [Pseudonocardiales bacterium]
MVRSPILVLALTAAATILAVLVAGFVAPARKQPCRVLVTSSPMVTATQSAGRSTGQSGTPSLSPTTALSGPSAVRTSSAGRSNASKSLTVPTRTGSSVTSSVPRSSSAVQGGESCAG